MSTTRKTLAVVAALAIILLVASLGWFVVRDSCPTGNDRALCEAESRGNIRVTIWGDSISEGTSQVSSYSMSWVGLLRDRMSEHFPEMNWRFTNLSVAGQSMFVAANPEAHVATTALAHRDEDLWPTQYGPDRSWIENVKASRPDILFIAFGMNASDPETGAFEHSLSHAIDQIRAWEKVPTIVVVTPMSPSLNPESMASSRLWVEALADDARVVASRTGAYLVDASAFHSLYNRRGFTEEDLLGVIGGQDGNGMNHPTALGHRILYFEPSAHLLDRMLPL